MLEFENEKSEELQEFLKANKFKSKLYEFIRDGLIYGNSYWEIYSRYGKYHIAPLSPLEIDFQRDSMHDILFKGDKPKGYIQTRRGMKVAEWNLNSICHFQPIKLSGRETGISAIQHVMNLAISSNEVIDLVIEYLYRCLPLSLVKITNASERDIDEVEEYLSSSRINLRDHFCFSDRFEFMMSAPKGNRIEMEQHYKLFLSLFAGAFSIPPALLVPGVQSDRIDFAEQMHHFYESLTPFRSKLIETLEEDLFGIIFPDEEIKLYFPTNPMYSEREYLNSIGFLTEAGVISPQKAQEMLLKRGFIDQMEKNVPDYSGYRSRESSDSINHLNFKRLDKKRKESSRIQEVEDEKKFNWNLDNYVRNYNK